MESDNNDGLKRSARHATQLVKWLLIDWKEGKNIDHHNQQSEFNIFTKSFLSLPLDYYRHMRLELHVKGDERGGTREDACQIIKLILLHHLSEDGERPSLVMIEELLQMPKAVEEFDIWSTRIPVEVQEGIKKNALARQAEIANRQRQDAIAKAAGGNTNPNLATIQPGMMMNAGDQDAYDQMLLEDSENQDDDEKKGDDGDQGGKGGNIDDEKDDDSYYDPDENDALAAIRRRQKQARKEAEQALYHSKDGKKGNKSSMISATRWEDSKVAREQAARAAAAARAGQHDTVRDSQDAAAELLEREEEKAKVLGRDPLGILNFEDYDLRIIERKHAEQIEQALQEINEEIQKAENVNNDELLRKAILQKESLETLVERMGGIEAMEQQTTSITNSTTNSVGGTSQSNNTNNNNNNRASILPTNPKFDPILFLTLLHRKTPYSTLLQSLDRLSCTYNNNYCLLYHIFFVGVITRKRL